MISAANCDLHSHTIYSDGRSGIEENVHAAEALGLEALALTDHLYLASAEWGDRAKLRQRREEVRQASAWATTRLIMGLEATTTSASGAISISPADLEGVELALVDVGFETAGLASGMPRGKDGQLSAVFGLYTSLAANVLVDVLAHPFSLGRFGLSLMLDDLPSAALRELGQSLGEHGVAFELNNGLWWWWPQYHPLKLAEAYARVVTDIAAGGAQFTLGSDAHCNTGIGNFGWASRVATLAGISGPQWADVERLVLRAKSRSA